MIQSEKQGMKELLKVAAPYIIVSTIYSCLVLVTEEILGDHIYKISGQIGSVFGLAVAFFLGFRMNSAYDRWWEARKILGELTNNSRSFVAKTYIYFKNKKNIIALEDTKNITHDLIDLNIVYVKQLADEIHQHHNSTIDNPTKQLFEKCSVNTNNKVSNEILIAMGHLIETNFSEKSNIEKSDLMQHLNRFYDIQGKAERIRNTPFLKIYSVFTQFIVGFYVLLIPLFIGDIDLGGEESYYEFISIPIMVIISSAFLTINKLANLFGEPFSENKTSVSIDNICNTIVQNCLEVRKKV